MIMQFDCSQFDQKLKMGEGETRVPLTIFYTHVDKIVGTPLLMKENPTMVTEIT